MLLTLVIKYTKRKLFIRHPKLKRLVPALCEDFPLRAEHPVLEGKGRCRKIHGYFHNVTAQKGNVMECFKDKTLILIGDSRAKQLFAELVMFFDETRYDLR